MSINQIVARLQEATKLEAAPYVSPKEEKKAVDFFTHLFGVHPKPCTINTPHGTQREDREGVCYDGVHVGSVKCKVTLANLGIYIEPQGNSPAAKDLKEMYKGLLADTFEHRSGFRSIDGMNAKALVKSFANDAKSMWTAYASKYNSPEFVAKHYRKGQEPYTNPHTNYDDYDPGIDAVLKAWSSAKL